MGKGGLLVILGGLPGVGKTSIARALSLRVGAVHLRIDSIEAGLRASQARVTSVEDAGYQAAYRVAGDNLRIGHVVVADAVNPVLPTRQAWLAVAAQAGVPALQVEIRCSDVDEHRRRVEERHGLRGPEPLPTWQDVLDRGYQPWSGVDCVLDTAQLPLATAVETLRAAVLQRAAPRSGRPDI